MLKHLPLRHPQPDAKKCIAVLMGRVPQSRPPLVEYIVDDVVMRPIVTELLGRTWVPEAAERAAQQAYLDNLIVFWHRLGYDFIRIERNLPLPTHQMYIPDAAPASDKIRAWPDEHQGAIRTWEDFERYPWPTVAEMDFFPFEYINAHLPEGMGMIVSHGGGVFEHLSWIMSLEGLCHALYEAPDLVKAIADRLGQLMVGFYEQVLGLERLIAIFPGDDMGFRTATLVSPQTLRELILPWHKRFAAMAHARGLPYFLHSCGQLEKIMSDLIEEVGIDGKHSFEDLIIPVQDFQTRYGDRIAVLGGMDVNRLAGDSPQEVRRHARFLIETCGRRGRYALGSGNSIPSYVPPENYLAMLDELFEVI